ncbi:MAG: DUF2332 domain-containing protein [Acidimicrobiales bacterium]
MSTLPPNTVPLDDVLRFQRDSCAALGSSLYADLLEATAIDVAAGGPCASALRPHEGDPFGSALPLRFLGAIHRLVLDGRAPALAAHYPSVGGAPRAGLVDDFLATVPELRAEIEARIDDGVQTNEVGRAAALVGGFVEVARRSGLPLRVLEVGASAGLNLRWDQFWYDTGASSFGDPGSPVRFVGMWEGSLPVLDDVPVTVAERAGCDRSPIDPTSQDGRRTLRSYLWPDMRDRLARLDAALDVAARVPASVDAADVGDWLGRRLADPVAGVATVVYHSIVWQYLPARSRDRMRVALRRAGEAAPAGAPVAWLRLEPSGPVADLRLTYWPGGGGADGGGRAGTNDEVLATSKYHGVPVYWGTRGERP